MGNASSSRAGWIFGDDVKDKHEIAVMEQPSIEGSSSGNNEKLTPDEYLNTLFCSAILSDALHNITSDQQGKDMLEGLANTYPFFQPKEAHISVNGDFMFCELDTMMVVAFRGTASIDDWMGTNLVVRRKRSERLYGGDFEVHEGFFDCADEAPLDAAWGLASSCSKRLVFTGHSKGGAAAEIAARLACLENGANQLPGGKLISCVTFGQPHVAATEGFPSASRGRLILHRYILDDDIVPFALRGLFDFFPTGTFFQINDDIVDGSRSSKLEHQDASSRGRDLDFVCARLNARAISSHEMARYKRSLLQDAQFDVHNAIICSVRKSMVPWALAGSDPDIQATWKGTRNNIVSVSIKAENESVHEAWKYSFTQAVLTLSTRSNENDSVRDLIVKAKPGRAEVTRVIQYSPPDRNTVSQNVSIMIDFQIPEGFIPDDGSYHVRFRHSMHPFSYDQNDFLSLRTVWFVGDTGAGKTHLITCLNILATHGNQSEEFLNHQEQHTTAAPADDEATFRSCGIFFRELLGARFHDGVDQRYFARQLLECPPKMVVFVANSRTKHSCDESTRRGLKYIAEDLRELIRPSALRSRAERSVGICWAFTQWANVPKAAREATREDMKAVLGVAGDEQVFEINSGVIVHDSHRLPIFGVEELLDYIRVTIRDRQDIQVDWKYLRTIQLLAREIFDRHGGKFCAATLAAAWLALFKVPLPVAQ